MAASAQAVYVPTMGGRLFSARFFEASVAASGRSIANQYTVRRASIQLRAWRAVGVRRVVDDLFRPRRIGERPPADLVADRATLTGEHLAAYVGA
jgi:hypothetical protein